MKVLLDSCVSGVIVGSALVEAGHDVVWAGDWESDPGDEEILAQANRENRVLVMLDKDFGALAVQHGQVHKGILRLANLATSEQSAICLHVLTNYQAELISGAILTAERTRVRIRLTE